MQSTSSGNKYYIDGTETRDLDFVVGNTYVFDLSNSSNALEETSIILSTTQNGTWASRHKIYNWSNSYVRY